MYICTDEQQLTCNSTRTLNWNVHLSKCVYYLILKPKVKYKLSSIYFIFCRFAFKFINLVASFDPQTSDLYIYTI